MQLRKELERFYQSEGLEEVRLRRDSVQYLEFETAAKYLTRYLHKGWRVLDNCAGTGVYSFYLAERGLYVTAGDIVPYNVEIIRKKQEAAPALSMIYEGDALDLSRFTDGSFDAVLLMGALYHMPDPAERENALRESLRVLRPGGILAATYMNRYGVILGDSAGDLDNLDEILAFAKQGREGIFYASTPEEIRELMDREGVKPLCHLALDGMAWFMHLTAGLLTEAGFKRWHEYHLATCETPSLLGCSYHNMYFGRKH